MVISKSLLIFTEVLAQDQVLVGHVVLNQSSFLDLQDLLDEKVLVNKCLTIMTKILVFDLLISQLSEIVLPTESPNFKNTMKIWKSL